MRVGKYAIASLLKRATTSRHSATSSASKNSVFSRRAPSRHPCFQFTESPHQRTARSDRPGDPACGPVAHHARHVRRCLPHNAAAAVASPSRGVDSTTHGEPLIDATREQTQPPRSMLEATPATSARGPASPLPAKAARRPTQRPPIRPAR